MSAARAVIAIRPARDASLFDTKVGAITITLRIRAFIAEFPRETTPPSSATKPAFRAFSDFCHTYAIYLIR